MIPLDLSGKNALVTGVGDDKSFAWFIAKTLQAAGARLVFAVHPRMTNIVESFLTRAQDAPARMLPFGVPGELKAEKVIPCDVRFDTMADLDEATKNDKRFMKHGDFTIEGMMTQVKAHWDHIDILIHSIAFSPEITKRALETSRAGYLTAISISAYSLTALVRAALPLMENRPDGASVLGLTYMASERVVPFYGGGMASAKAALEIDAKQLASNVGPKGIRVNLISAGPYDSRAADAIVDMKKVRAAFAKISALPRGIEAQEVANATLFLCSPLASAITGEVMFVDCGYSIMGAPPSEMFLDQPGA
jgi:enoyl-[acyl-carrier protein] reductase I